MRPTRDPFRSRARRTGALAALTLLASTLGVAAGVAGATPAQAQVLAERSPAAVDCITPDAHEHADGADAARGGHGADHRSMTAAEQERVRRDFEKRLAAARDKGTGARTAQVTVPVYVHVMRDANGAGDVTDSQITQQIAVMNRSFAGGASSSAADLGFTFTLAGVDRFNNTTWHQDKQSTTYRSQTRKGGKNALNIWLVDFDYLGIATFPWDYASNPGIDGIRVQYSSLPGGPATNYNLGETATHEAGHWFGLYHTFQGGCTTTNDEVSDTPAQSSSTSGCPEGRDSCSLPGLDPIHNYMDYSYDSCYTMFTTGQATRAQQMWTAYRA